MKFSNCYLLPVFLLLMFSCGDKEDQLPTINSSTISLSLTDLEEETKYQNVLVEAESKVVFRNTSYEWNEDSIVVKRSATFVLEGNEFYPTKFIVLELVKFESKENMVFDSFYQKWNYRSLQDEQNLFFKRYDQAAIMLNINFKYAFNNVDSQSDDFRIVNMKKVMVNGKETWAIEAEFKGKFGGGASEIFEVKNGKFKGVLK